MPSRKEILRNNFKASRIDFVGAFIRLWVSFNTWYNDYSNARSELNRVLSSAKSSTISTRYWDELNNLNNAAHNDNYQHIIDTVVDASTVSYKDSNGNPAGWTNDSTGFVYRLRCNRTNAHTDFIRACIDDTDLVDWGHGLVQFNTETRADKLFKEVYFGYKQYMFNHMYLKFDAFNGIPDALSNMGIKQYGCTLIHQLDNKHAEKSEITSLKEIYGHKFIGLRNKALKFNSKNAVLKAYPKVGYKGKLYRWYECKGNDLLERELTLLYKLRSSIIHGDRDPSSKEAQKLAMYAYYALDDLMTDIFV